MPKKLLAAFVLTLLWSAIAQAQDHAIHGYVIAPSKKHIDNFEIFVTVRDAEEVIARTSVSGYGEYMFKNVPTGYFDILIRLPGFRESRTPLQSGNPEQIAGDRQFFITMNIVLIPDADGPFLGKEAAYTDAIVEEYGKGLDEITNNHPELAVTHLENVVHEVPDFADAHTNLGLVYLSLSRRRDAEKEFRAAIELNGESSRPFLALGRTYLEDVEVQLHSRTNVDDIQPRLVQAREVLTQATMLDPKSAAAFYHLGAVEYRAANYKTAESELKHALELDPTLFPARIMLINVYVQLEMWQDALDNADAFLIENPGSPFRSDVFTTRSQLVKRLQRTGLR